MTSPTPRVYEFGPFRVDAEERVVTREGRPVPLTPKPFELLLALLERAGQVVEKAELMQRVWPETAVEENNLNQCVSAVRRALGDGQEGSRYVETVPRRGYRFVAKVREAPAAGPAGPQREEAAAGERVAGRSASRHAALAILAAAAVALAGIALYRRPRPALTEKDTVVLADFTNGTGDAVFDDTLTQALAIQLEQSPFLNVLSDQKVNATLKLMNRRPGERVNAETAVEICRRTASKALLAGAITRLGSRYLITLKASDCQSGDSLGSAEAGAARREEVITALGRVAESLRGKLGESLPSLRRHARPLDEATTSSLEALQAFTQGRRAARERGDADALPYLRRAVELDPTFASAHASLGGSYLNLGQAGPAIESYRKAFDLRERVSERERLYIEGIYHLNATGELHRAAQVFRHYAGLHPQDADAHAYLGVALFQLGQWTPSAAACREALRLEPDHAFASTFLMADYLGLGRLAEAREVYEAGRARGQEHGFQEALMYLHDFAVGDAAGMRRRLEAVAGKPGFEDLLLTMESDTEAHHGRMRRARELSARAADSARSNGALETAALWVAYGALHEAELGLAAEAQRQAAAALALAPGRDVRVLAALALARAGGAARAEALAEALGREFPLDTLMQRYVLPTVRAILALERGAAREALESLQPTSGYELAAPQAFYYTEPPLYPVYVRGQAYLRTGQGALAAAEFQKMAAHRWMNYPLGALARLQLGRARAMSGDREGARAAYEEFLGLWKDADPAVPILGQARSEYERLRSSGD